MKKLLILLGLLLASPAFAVDNTVIVTPGTGITMRSKDVGSGVESMIHILGDTSGNPIYGTAGTANANILTVQGIAAMTPLLATVTGTVAATQSGTWNIGSITTLPALVAGSAIIGKVGIDQTTPGTTNGVQVNSSALPTGAGTAANQATIITALGTLNTTAGAPIVLPLNVTPTDCSGTVTTGGTAVNAFTAQTTLHGFTILNDDTSEPLWISFTTTAAASTAASYPLAPATVTSFAGASSFTSPPGFGTNHALSVVAATNAHKFSCTWW